MPNLSIRGARDNLHMINIDTVRHDNAPPARFDLGARIPLATTAMGRAYLFALPAGSTCSIRRSGMNHMSATST